ncbi:hypothetical protein B0H14DRAFT_2856880, partial [Mycena olivaceomarginata]
MRRTDEGEQAARWRRLQVRLPLPLPPHLLPLLLKFGVGVPSSSCARAVPARTTRAGNWQRAQEAQAALAHPRPCPEPLNSAGPARRRPYLNLLRPFTRPIIFTIAIRTPAVRDIGDEWRERDRVGHSVDNAAPTTAGDAAREHADRDNGDSSCARERLSRRPG